MKRKYLRLNLKDSYFWQSNKEKGIVEEKQYEMRKEDCLNYLYFKVLTPNILIEELTHEKLILNSNNKEVLLPKGIKINFDNFEECSSSNIMDSFNEIKTKNLNKEYYQIICDFIYRSNLCAYKEEKKNNKSLNLTK